MNRIEVGILANSKNKESGNFVVQFPLKTQKYQEGILNKRFEIGRMMYNALLNITQKR